MMKSKLLLVVVASTLLSYLAVPAGAWHRSPATIFAILPEGATGPEGLTVGPDGNIYVATFGFTTQGPATGNGQMYVYDPQGRLLRHVSIQNSTPFLLGLAFNPVTGDLLVLDTAVANPSATPQVLRVDPHSGHSSLFFTASGRPGFNALTFDKNGNVYVSDSFQGTIWTCDAQCSSHVATAWKTDPLLSTSGVPPFGANGVEFNNAGTAMFVANTGNDTLVKIEVNSNGSAGAASVFVNSINGADGIAVDGHDNIWVAANQADEIVVVDPTGKVIAKLGDFDGISEDGVPRGLLFPASPAFSADGRWLYVTNLSLDLRLFGLPTVDAPWCAQVKHYTVSRIPARVPPVGGPE